MTSSARLSAVSSGAPWAVARESGLIGSIPYTLEMKFYTDSPRIDCWMRFSFSGQRIGRLSDNKRDSSSGFIHEHKLRFKMFPAVNEKAVGIRDLPFAISQTSDNYVNGLYWTAVTDGRNGMSIFNQGTMGAVREKDGGYSIPLAYAMYYIWGTRMLTGDFIYEIAMCPFTGKWTQASLHKKALEYNFPLCGLAALAGNGKLGNSICPLEISSSNVVASALFHKQDGLYVRMYEHRGRDCQVSLKYTFGQANMTEVNFADRGLSATSGRLNFKPWQIKTVRINPSR